MVILINIVIVISNLIAILIRSSCQSLGVVWTYGIISSLLVVCVLITIFSCSEKRCHKEIQPPIGEYSCL